MISTHSNQPLVIAELNLNSGGDYQLLAPLILQHVRTGVCPVGDESQLALFIIKSHVDMFWFTYVVSDIMQVAVVDPGGF